MSTQVRQFRAGRTITYPLADAHPWRVFDYENSRVACCPSCGKLAYFRTRTEALVFEREANTKTRLEFANKTAILEPLVAALQLADVVIDALLKDPQEHTRQAREDLDLIRGVLGAAQEEGR